MKTGIQRFLVPALILAAGFGLGLLVDRDRKTPPEGAEPAAGAERRSAGALSPATGFPARAGAVEARDFRALSGADRELIADRIRAFHAAGDDEERLELLDRIDGECYGRDFLGLARSVLGARQPAMSGEVRERVVEMLAGNASDEILPVLELAREGAGEDERIAIMMAAVRVRGGAVEDFIADGFVDPAKNVRFSALDAADLQAKDARERLLARAMKSPRSDVALAGLAELEVDATAASMPVLMDGLSSPNEEVRAEALDTLEFLLDEEFDDAEEARSWWAGNRQRFDRDLIRID